MSYCEAYFVSPNSPTSTTVETPKENPRREGEDEILYGPWVRVQRRAKSKTTKIDVVSQVKGKGAARRIVGPDLGQGTDPHRLIQPRTSSPMT